MKSGRPPSRTNLWISRRLLSWIRCSEGLQDHPTVKPIAMLQDALGLPTAEHTEHIFHEADVGGLVSALRGTNDSTNLTRQRGGKQGAT